MTRSFESFAPFAFAIVLVVFFLSGAAAIWLRWPRGRPLSAASLTLAGVVYTGGGISFAVLLRHLPDSSFAYQPGLPFQRELLLIFPLAVTWAADSAAYFFGHLLGNRKLIPSVSPGKTVVGGVAGLVTALLVGILVCGVALGLHPDRLLSAVLGGIIGLLLGVAAQVGDLVESVLKREAGVKDSGTFFPGHGGFLDRFDATIYTLPLAYALIRLAGMIP
jgi:phosphatidate cytidylyltransferase